MYLHTYMHTYIRERQGPCALLRICGNLLMVLFVFSRQLIVCVLDPLEELVSQATTYVVSANRAYMSPITTWVLFSLFTYQLGGW
jgi:hypothetical protein